MSISNIFSKRQKKLRGEVPDVYTYDKIPEPFRVQIIHRLRDTIGNAEDCHSSFGITPPFYAYKSIVEALRREYRRFALIPQSSSNRKSYLFELSEFLMLEKDTEKVLDAIELSFQYIDRSTRDHNYLQRCNASERADSAIEELNFRFREHGVGYQFVEGEILRLDSEFIHAEVVKPALSLLHTSHYAGAQEEFLKAHEHSRHGRQKEALAECLKALESVMKTICTKRNWAFNPNATSQALLQALFDNGLIPSFWNSHFAGLRSTLESGIPTARNRLGGHGQGTQVVEVPEHLVSYVLHQTASAIVFLVEAEKVLP